MRIGESKQEDSGQYKRAIQDYDEVIRLNLQDAKAYYNRDVTHTAIGKSKEAEGDFTKAEELRTEEKEPRSSRLGNMLGESFWIFVIIGLLVYFGLPDLDTVHAIVRVLGALSR